MIKSSHYWKTHFSHNLTQQRIDWSFKPAISDVEQANILSSLQAWQLGETSDGAHLLHATRKHAHRTKDPELIKAMKLFIKEEQKHGENLGKYLDAIGERRIKKNLGDSMFRFIRGLLTNMEVWTITVVIVESAAQIFYQALCDATNCKLLQSICSDILIDEAHHIKFQNERLHLIFAKKSFYLRAFAVSWYCLLFFGTIHAIWFDHNKAFRAGGVSKDMFMKKMYQKFFKTIQYIHQDEHATKTTEMRVVS